MDRARNRQTGVMLIEALLGILIFAIGILALIAMQATAIRAAQDSRYRTEAVNYASDLLNQMVVNINRTGSTQFTDSLAAFRHQTGGTDCAFSGSASTSAVVTGWAELVSGTPPQTNPPRLPLPGTTPTMLQVLVDDSVGAFNRVTITVCWRGPDDPVARKHILVSYLT
ncbi:MAG: type IV pilus modification protein PilV [Burkholderiales bacterium]